MARPSRWHEWAPQLRGAWGLGEPEGAPGARGARSLLVRRARPAVITRVDVAEERMV
jgi:hypothetical protein